VRYRRWSERLTRLGRRIMLNKPPERWVEEAEKELARMKPPQELADQFLEWITQERDGVLTARRLARDTLRKQAEKPIRAPAASPVPDRSARSPRARLKAALFDKIEGNTSPEDWEQFKKGFVDGFLADIQDLLALASIVQDAKLASGNYPAIQAVVDLPGFIADKLVGDPQTRKQAADAAEARLRAKIGAIPSFAEIKSRLKAAREMLGAAAEILGEFNALGRVPTLGTYVVNSSFLIDSFVDRLSPQAVDLALRLLPSGPYVAGYATGMFV
jgi:hypothetical protein